MNNITSLLPHLKLHFNIDHPSLEECYVFGYECASADISEEENPFRTGSQESEHWLEGWWAGFYGEEPRYQLSDFSEISSSKEQHCAANDQLYNENVSNIIALVLEITGIIAVSAAVGYQVIELVA